MVRILTMTTLLMPMIIIQEQVFIAAINRKCSGRYTQPWESSLETVPPFELPCVSPPLAVASIESARNTSGWDVLELVFLNALSSPGIVGGHTSCCPQLGNVEARVGTA